jgi:hypothetical protein
VDITRKSIIADLVTQHMAHTNTPLPKGNVVYAVTFTKTADADRDLGVMGTVTEVKLLIAPTPHVDAVNVTMVNKSGGALQYSDLKMTVSRDSLTNDMAIDQHTEFDVNGIRYQVQAFTPGPSAWEFVIRRKALAPSQNI